MDDELSGDGPRHISSVRDGTALIRDANGAVWARDVDGNVLCINNCTSDEPVMDIEHDDTVLIRDANGAVWARNVDGNVYCIQNCTSDEPVMDMEHNKPAQEMVVNAFAVHGDGELWTLPTPWALPYALMGGAVTFVCGAVMIQRRKNKEYGVIADPPKQSAMMYVWSYHIDPVDGG